MLLASASGLYAQPAAMKTREFKVDFDLREMGRSLKAPEQPEPAAGGDPFGPPAAPAAGTDPFGPDRKVFRPAKPPQILTSKDVLTQMGISFPEGSTAFYDSRTNILRVHNTPAMLDLIEAFVDSTGEGFPRDIVYTLTVIEGPGEIIRQTNAAAARTADASAEFRKLLDQAKQPASKVRIVSDAYVPAKSGTRATAEAAQERIHTTGLTFDAQGHATLKREMQPLGLELELEPVIGADGITLSTSVLLRLNLAAPELRPVSITDPGTGNAAEYAMTDFFHAEFNTSISSRSGSTKLIGVTAPLGPAAAREDRLCAVFLTGTIHVQEPVPRASPPPPAPPSKALPAGMQEATLQVPAGLLTDDGWTIPPRTLQGVLQARGLPAANGASAVQKDGLLHIINTPDNIERIAVLVDNALEKAPKTIACTLHTVQAPAAFLRGLAQASAATSDHAALWAQVEAAVARGEGRFIDSLFVETKPEARAKQVSASECLHVEEFGLDAKGRAIPGIAYRNVGSTFEVEPVLNYDGRTVNIMFSYELHPTQPAMRREAFRDPASGLRFDLPVADFHVLHTVTGLIMPQGGTRLISLYQPTGRAAEGMLWATFLKCDVVPQVRPPQGSPHPAHPIAPPDPDSWHTQTFKVPPNFLSSAGSFDSSPSEDKSSKEPRTARSVLESAGIPFPQGASALFDPAHSLLIVRNTRRNLDLVEAYTDLNERRTPSTIAYTAQVFQGPGPLLRQLTAQAAGKCDHRSELDALLAAVKAGTVQPLSTARIETKFGTQATATQAHTHTNLNEVKVNDKNETEIVQDTRQVGLTLSIEPAGRSDGLAIESTLKLEFHPAEPLEHREHVIDSQGHQLELPLTDYQVVHLTTSTLIPSGAARLVGLWKPTGKPEFEQEDILQMLIITCDQLWVEP
jgi:hypothetical protein